MARRREFTFTVAGWELWWIEGAGFGGNVSLVSDVRTVIEVGDPLPVAFGTLVEPSEEDFAGAYAAAGRVAQRWADVMLVDVEFVGSRPDFGRPDPDVRV